MPGWPQQPPIGTPLRWGDSLLDGLVAFWPFWEGGGDKVFDLSGNDDHGTLTNMTPATVWRPGFDGSALYFGGTNEFIALGTSITDRFSRSGTFALSALVRVDDVAADHTIIGAWSSQFLLWMDENSALDRYGIAVKSPDTEVSYSANSSAKLGVWQHVVGVYDGSQILLYIDGIQSGTPTAVPGALANVSVLAAIGADNPADTSRTWQGLMANVAAYDRPLAAQEALRLYRDPWAMFRSPTEWFPAAVAPPTGTVNPFSMGAINLLTGKVT